MAGSNSVMSIGKLTGRDNWSSWSFAVKAYLQHEDLYDCILKEPDCTDISSVKQDIKAKSKLILLVDPMLYVHIQEAQNAKQVWDNLAKAFEDSGLTRKVGLLKELINTNLENSLSIEDYVNKIMSAAHKLRNIKFHVDDEWLGTLMLAGLPEVYRPMIMGLESSGMKISADLVKNKLLQEVQKSDTTALYTNSKSGQAKIKKGPRCFHCNKYGHLSDDCWHKKTKKENKNTGYAAAFSASAKKGFNYWHVDSGASMHMTMHRDWLTEIKPPSVSSIRIANNKVLKVECCGNVCIKVNAKDGSTDMIQVRNVLFVPELKRNLLSVSKIIKSGCRVVFNKHGCQIYNPSNKLVANADLVNETYRLSTCMLAKTDTETKKEAISKDDVILEFSFERDKEDKVPPNEKEKKIVDLRLCDEPEEPVERNSDYKIHGRGTQTSQSTVSSDSDQFEDVNDVTYVLDRTVDSQQVTNMILRPRQQRLMNQDEDQQSPSSLMCQNPQSSQEALYSEKAEERQKAMNKTVSNGSRYKTRLKANKKQRLRQ